MKTTQLSIAIGLGDHIMIRGYLDTIKHQYREIRISHEPTTLLIWRNNDPIYGVFMNELGKLIFSEKPYIFDHQKYQYKNQQDVLREYNISPKKPELGHLLCKGNSLNLGEEYIIITTKVRVLNKKIFYPVSIKLWRTLRELSKKYKIVILGEREVERSREYSNETTIMEVYSLYEQIISNIPKDRILDLTVPALGITSPALAKVQQDCLIMKEAKFVITVGVGGNFCMASSVGKVIGFRADIEYNIDCISKHPDIFTSRDCDAFIAKLKEHL